MTILPAHMSNETFAALLRLHMQQAAAARATDPASHDAVSAWKEAPCSPRA